MILLKKIRSNLRKLEKYSGVSLGLSEDWSPPDINKLRDTPVDNLLSYYPPIDPKKLNTELNNYGIPANVLDYHIASRVTTYKIKIKDNNIHDIPSKITSIMDQMGISLTDVISLPPDKYGIVIPNETNLFLGIKDFLKDMPTNMTLPFIVGENYLGEFVYKDMASMPHLLVAGVTGSGKSVFLNSLICGYLAKMSPDDLQMLLIDPKEVEFMDYEDIPHLMEPIASEIKDSVDLLDKAIDIMEDRFDKLKGVRARNIREYLDKTDEKLPYILMVIDEYADLMLMGTTKERKEVEKKIARIAQKARAVGIHLVLATQKPIATVVTSVLKANLPARIAFNVATGTDSRVILDQKGAEKLTGKGDLLFKDPYGNLTRAQAPWISPEDILTLTKGGV